MNFRALSFSSAPTHPLELSYGKMLKLLHRRRSLSLTLHQYPKEGMEVMDLVMLTEPGEPYEIQCKFLHSTAIQLSLASMIFFFFSFLS